MREFTEETLTEAVVARLARCEDPRFRQIMTTLIRHVHSFVREVELTEAEWMEAIQFLTAAGQKCVGDRQEFILLSDVLGVSMLVDAINHRKPSGATESTVLGPFYAEGAPELPHGTDIAHGGPGEPTEVSCRVLTPDSTAPRIRSRIALTCAVASEPTTRAPSISGR
jgi:hydroxyquinol 1,2-dioxygenase